MSLALTAEQPTLSLRFSHVASNRSLARVHADRGLLRLKCQVAAPGGHIPAGSISAKDEGPSCMFVGPVEEAERHILEAFYEQVSSGSRPVVLPT